MDQSDADQLNPLMSQVPEDNSRDNRPFPLPACVSSDSTSLMVLDRMDDQQNPLMSRVPEDNSRDNRPFPLPACVSSGLAAVISVFCIGLVSGAAGGLLLGATAVIMLQSLELLADNRLFMEQLEKYILRDYFLGWNIQRYVQWEKDELVHDIKISIFVVMFGVFSSTLSLAAGIYIGLSTYSLVIKIKGEGAMGKALAMAGLVCVTGVSATGYIVGFTLEKFISISLHVDILFWCPISLVLFFVMLYQNKRLSSSYMRILLTGVVRTSISTSFTIFQGFSLAIRFNLVFVLIPITMTVKALGKSQSLKLTTAPVRWMLIISDVYYIAGWQIVSLQSPTSTNISSAVVEAIFVGVLASLLWSVTVGMSLFVSWQKDGAFKICATAAGFGTTVLGAIKMTLPVLGPGPTIGALIGVAGAVGVSLSAAVAVADQFGQALDRYGVVGRLGLTVGAAVGAFLSSCAHSGLSGMFMALCAATITAGAFTILFLHRTSWESEKFVYVNRIRVVLVLCTYTGLFCINHTKFYVAMFLLCIVLGPHMLIWDHCYIEWLEL